MEKKIFGISLLLLNIFVWIIIGLITYKNYPIIDYTYAIFR